MPQTLNYVCVCDKRITEAREIIEVAGKYIIIPYSNSQAHRLADKYQCEKFYVEDINALKQILIVLKKFVHDKYEVVEINDIRWYPEVVEYKEVLVDNDDIYIEYYNTGITHGYYGEHKKKKITVNITNTPF